MMLAHGSTKPSAALGVQRAYFWAQLFHKVPDEPVKRCRAALSDMQPRLGLILASRQGKAICSSLLANRP
jgi:hypothetical protein